MEMVFQETKGWIQDTSLSIQDIGGVIQDIVHDNTFKILFKIPGQDSAHDVKHDIVGGQV